MDRAILEETLEAIRVRCERAKGNEVGDYLQKSLVLNDISFLLAVVECLTRERDAAVADLCDYPYRMCTTCVHDNKCDKKDDCVQDGYQHWQWRGVN